MKAAWKHVKSPVNCKFTAFWNSDVGDDLQGVSVLETTA